MYSPVSAPTGHIAAATMTADGTGPTSRAGLQEPPSLPSVLPGSLAGLIAEHGRRLRDRPPPDFQATPPDAATEAASAKPARLREQLRQDAACFQQIRQALRTHWEDEIGLRAAADTGTLSDAEYRAFWRGRGQLNESLKIARGYAIRYGAAFQQLAELQDDKPGSCEPIDWLEGGQLPLEQPGDWSQAAHRIDAEKLGLSMQRSVCGDQFCGLRDLGLPPHEVLRLLHAAQHFVEAMRLVLDSAQATRAAEKVQVLEDLLHFESPHRAPLPGPAPDTAPAVRAALLPRLEAVVRHLFETSGAGGLSVSALETLRALCRNEAMTLHMNRCYDLPRSWGLLDERIYPR